jgi:hypothetical protein
LGNRGVSESRVHDCSPVSATLKDIRQICNEIRAFYTAACPHLSSAISHQHQTSNLGVAGSSPAGRAIFFSTFQIKTPVDGSSWLIVWLIITAGAALTSCTVGSHPFWRAASARSIRSRMTGLLHKGIKLTGAQKLIVSPNTVCLVCRTPLIMVPHILDGRCPVSVSRLRQTR